MAIYKPKAISGFPEWLPEVRRIEQQWLDIIRKTFEKYGYASIETPSVEELDVILAKGDTDKEIYLLKRLQEEEEATKESRLALCYDLTVPLARYVAEHFNELSFPFKRYQMQKRWRGERPQHGRFREFYQCDIDVINIDNLSIHFDAEMPLIANDILEQLDIGDFYIQISNRKILAGFLQGLGVSDTAKATRIIDKLDKIGEKGVYETLIKELSLSDEQAQK